MNTTKVKYTRSDYMSNKCSHREYYSQFVNDDVKSHVIKHIGLSKLLSSKDKHLNDIPLREWDSLGGFAFRRNDIILRPRSIDDIKPIDYELLKEAGEGLSPATSTCIYKEAAKEIIEEELKDGVKPMINPSTGKPTANHSIIKMGKTTYLQSYKTIIAKKKGGEVYLESGKNWRYDWKATPTTSKYRNIFLGETTKKTQSKIDSGEYKLVDLNK